MSTNNPGRLMSPSTINTEWLTSSSTPSNYLFCYSEVNGNENNERQRCRSSDFLERQGCRSSDFFERQGCRSSGFLERQGCRSSGFLERQGCRSSGGVIDVYN